MGENDNFDEWLEAGKKAAASDRSLIAKVRRFFGALIVVGLMSWVISDAILDYRVIRNWKTITPGIRRSDVHLKIGEPLLRERRKDTYKRSTAGTDYSFIVKYDDKDFVIETSREEEPSRDWD